MTVAAWNPFFNICRRFKMLGLFEVLVCYYASECSVLGPTDCCESVFLPVAFIQCSSEAARPPAGVLSPVVNILLWVGS